MHVCTVQVKKLSYRFRTVPSRRSETEAVITLSYYAVCVHAYHAIPYRIHTVPHLRMCIYRTAYNTVVIYYSGAHMLSNKCTPEIVYLLLRYGMVIRYKTGTKQYPCAVNTARH